MSLRQKTITGIIWSTAQQLSSQVITIVVQIVLARILMPEAFGLIAMLQIFVAIGKSLVDSGMTNSLIRQTNSTERDYSTVFYTNLLFSIFVYLLIFLLAPAVADFYRQPEIVSVLRIYSLTIVLQALVNVQVTMMTKAMNFKTQMMLELPSTIVGAGVAIWMAMHGWGVWALVWMYLARTILWVGLNWFYSGWRPRFLFDRSTFSFHFKYGYKLTLSGLIDSAYSNVYAVLIGRFFQVTQLGYYDRANTFRNIPVNTVSSVLLRVTFPVFASIQHDRDRLKVAYQKIMTLVLFFFAPVMTALAICAEPLFDFFLTEKWLPAVPYFQILCMAGILYPVHVYNLNILNVKGRSDLVLRLEVVKKLILTVLITLAVPFGIYGLVWVQIIASVLALWVNSFYSGRFIGYTVGQQVLDMLPVLAITGLTGGLVWVIDASLKDMLWLGVAGRIVISMTLFFTLYLLLFLTLKRSYLFEFRNIIKTIYDSRH